MLSKKIDFEAYQSQIDTFTRIVTRVLDIQDITSGDPKQNFLVRYRGRLRSDSAEAYDRLANELRPLEITPLFRKENDLQVVLLIPGVIRPRPSDPRVNLILFILTVFSMLLMGAASDYQGPIQDLFLKPLITISKGWPFALSLIAILTAHEFGHYLAGRFHNTHVTLPYFIPLPFLSPFGTMGAVIQLKEPPKNRRILLDIGIAGPLAGLVVAIPVLLLGLSLSRLDTLHAEPGFVLEGNSVIYLLAKFMVFGKLLPAPISYGTLSPALYWIGYFFTGHPIPLGGIDVLLHPVAWAGWAGLLVTGLNLIPAGQLDGGHLIYVLLGRHASKLVPFILAVLLLLGLVWNGWWILAFLIFLMGRLHAEPLDQITPLDTRRKALAVLGLIVFILVFTPIPLLAWGM